ncbi:hypothetical protein HDU91_006152 [Kappamyces sp. JEL0680]|nr:hypothetical protein HDU91_006152 [Kappamyces sp. JEL0680]
MSSGSEWDAMAKSPVKTRKEEISVEEAPYSFPTHKLKRSLSACGSYSPITYLHLRMFEMGYDYIADSEKFEIIGGYLSPVSDAYAKPGLAPWYHRVDMCALACEDSSWIMVDSWEPSQPSYIRTARVLDHFNEHLNGGPDGGCLMPDGNRQRLTVGSRKPIRIVLLAGGDLIQSFAVPNLWKEEDLHYILGEYGCLVIERTGANVHDFLLTHDSLHVHRVWRDGLTSRKTSGWSSNTSTTTFLQPRYGIGWQTHGRLFIKRGMSIRYLLPDPVVSYIHENKLYSS